MIREPGTPQLWHVLTESSVPVAEFSLALSRLADVIAWVPQISTFGLVQSWTTIEYSNESPTLRRVHFPLQRGFSRFPCSRMATSYRNIHRLLLEHTECPARTPLICTSSFYAPVAELWVGPVIYYATDYTFAYEGLSSERVLSADRAMCAIADLVCPNSLRLAEYFVERCRCAADRIAVIPNATRAANLRSSVADEPDPLPADVPPIPRPIAGVIGSMAANLDWEMLAQVIDKTPGYSWLFVGANSEPIREEHVRRARAKVTHMDKATFIGAKPYKDLFQYARAVDVAVMPYRKREPTYSGSATRFYEHLAAGRPIVSTTAVEELLHKEPLLYLVNTAEEMAEKLEQLKLQPRDGYEQERLIASQTETWERRAETMAASLRKSKSSKLGVFARSALADTQQLAATVR